jgi:PKD domain
MLSMRECAGLILSAVLCLGCLFAPGARADSYCPTGPCDHVVTGLQNVLDAASAHPGPDTILLRHDDDDRVTGLVYSDRGQHDNGIHILGGTRCDKYGCDRTEISGFAGGGPLLSFSGGGGAAVAVEQIRLFSSSTALELPPGGLARSIQVSAGRVGVVLDGTASRPAWLMESQVDVGYPPTRKGIGVDVPGHGFIVRSFVSAETAIRESGPGFAEIRGSSLNADTAFSGTRARAVGTVVDRFNFDAGAPPMVGFEVACPSADARDAELTLSSVAIFGRNHSDETGVRAIGRGGDGDSCDAVAHVANTVLDGLTLAFDARGEAGTGTEPRAGRARIEPAFSAFEAGATRLSGPGEIAGHDNVDPEPSRGWSRDAGKLLWGSMLIDSGNPAPLEPWEAPWVTVVNGRRDIGPYEYRYATPTAYIGPYPASIVRPGQAVELSSISRDDDWPDPLDLHWELSDGSTSTAETVTRVYARLGTYRERLTATDPTGRSDTVERVIRVVRQRLSGLTVRPRRLSLSMWRPRVRYRLRAYDEVRLSVDRAVRRHGRALRWRPVGSFTNLSGPGPTTTAIPLFLRHKRFTPGRYRLVAKAPTIRPVRVGFTVIR